MTSRAARFKSADLTRACNALRKAGITPGRFEIDPNGRIVILPDTGVASRPSNEWDEVLR
jgi:hypothetical protein